MLMSTAKTGFSDFGTAVLKLLIIEVTEALTSDGRLACEQVAAGLGVDVL